MKAGCCLLLVFVMLATGCSGVDEERGPAVVDVNAAAAQGQSDIDNYAAGRAITVSRRHVGRPGAEHQVVEMVRRYGAHLDSGRYGEAWRMREGTEHGSGDAERAFASRFARFARMRIEIGRAGGMLRDDRAVVPVTLYATLASGRRFTKTGSITLRRIAHVPGSRLGADGDGGWRIALVAL